MYFCTKEQGEVEAKVCKIHIHPDYQSVFQDVALLELCEPVKLTSKIKLIKYATKGEYMKVDIDFSF